MTTEEIKAYIYKYGNAEKTVETLKEMMAEGFLLSAITEQQLTDRLNNKVIDDLEALNDHHYSFATDKYDYLQQPQENYNYPSVTPTSSQEMPSIPKYGVGVAIGFIFGLIWGIIGLVYYSQMIRCINDGNVDKAWENAKNISKYVSLGVAINVAIVFLLRGA